MTLGEQLDPYLKKHLGLRLGEEELEFEVAHTLFASHEVDAGTKLLLRCLEGAPTPRNVLDLGCGYGVLGIALARRFPEAHVTMVDSNLLAVRYARSNATLNGAINTEVVGSVGLEEVPRGDYDLIVSNIPAKIGDEAIETDFVRAPRERLSPGGTYWLVAVSGLNHLLKRIESRGKVPIRQVRKRSGHSVYRLEA
ncbi:MAG: methyltransferase [Dehalococcoidia bacterium]|nr:methyltransferase [Dehalococcoidia bacterium]|tara:strand:- start:617 stop:1204 length:588 start_codon:yes stop_codon:yes gene_type:complete